jgi:RNA polymerase sigma factor (sigma-70 family)
VPRSRIGARDALLLGTPMSELLVRLEWFKAIVLPHEAAVRARLRRTCPPGFDVDNLVAEALLKAYQVQDFARITAGRGYLFAIARNLLIDALRREAVVSLDFVADLDILRSDDAMAERAIQARDELRWLQEVVDRLPPQPRQVFLLRRVHDLSPTAVAERMGLSVSTVEKHLAKALRLLAEARAQREDHEFGRSAPPQPGSTSDRRQGGRLRR